MKSSQFVAFVGLIGMSVVAIPLPCSESYYDQPDIGMSKQAAEAYSYLSWEAGYIALLEEACEEGLSIQACNNLDSARFSFYDSLLGWFNESFSKDPVFHAEDFPRIYDLWVDNIIGIFARFSELNPIIVDELAAFSEAYYSDDEAVPIEAKIALYTLAYELEVATNEDDPTEGSGGFLAAWQSLLETAHTIEQEDDYLWSDEVEMLRGALVQQVAT